MNKIEAAKLSDDEKDAECARLMALVEQDDTEAIELVMSIIKDARHPLVFPMLGNVMNFIDPPEKPQTLAEIFAEARANSGRKPDAAGWEERGRRSPGPPLNGSSAAGGSRSRCPA